MSGLRAGAASRDITPKTRQFLFGYPHVERYSTGVHDPLLSSALYLSDGTNHALFIANDIIFLGKESVRRIREGVRRNTTVAEKAIMITATHTHSGPVTVNHASNRDDPVVPPADPDYVRYLEEQAVAAATAAYNAAEPAALSLATADGSVVGTNRRDPAGPANPDVPVLIVRRTDDSAVACMLVCAMHPTVLHEDSTLVSADFPGMTRGYLHDHVLGPDCVVVYHTGPAGNQSPRHVTRGNTFEEAERLGHALGRSVEAAIAKAAPAESSQVRVARREVDLPRRELTPLEEAREGLSRARLRFDTLQREGAPRQEVRTAECDVFGAEETLALAKAAEAGNLDSYYKASLPAEVQVIGAGPWRFVGFPGELFVEYALALRERHPHTFPISLANGELQGYIVTEEAAAEGGYEASNALFSWRSGPILVEAASELVAEMET